MRSLRRARPIPARSTPRSRKTNKAYPTGRVKFTAKHYSAIPALQTQWQNGGTVVVSPKIKGGGTLQAPTPGLG